MSIKRWIRNWLLGDGVKLKGAVIREDTAYPSAEGTGISISEAINGKVLTLRTYYPNRKSNGMHAQSDWVTEYYVIKEGESLTEALTMLLVMRGVDK
jgi:hypothetical protein